MQATEVVAQGLFAKGTSKRHDAEVQKAGRTHSAVDSEGHPITLVNSRNTEASVIRRDDGTLFLVFSHFEEDLAKLQSDVMNDSAHGELWYATSRDNGNTWTPTQELFERKGRLNDMSPSLIRLASGKVLIGYLQKNDGEDCRYVVREALDETLLKWSPAPEPDQYSPLPGVKSHTSDESAPLPVTTQKKYHVVNNARMVQLSSGRVIIPVAVTDVDMVTTSGGGWRFRSHVLYSDNDGLTWQRSASVNLNKAYEAAFPGKNINAGAQEPGVVELSDGRLMMYVRSAIGYQYAAYSENGGETWSDPQPMTLGSSDEPKPLWSAYAPATIKAFKSHPGTLVMVWNPLSEKPIPGKNVYNRHHLQMSVSHDDGQSWGEPLTIEQNDDHSYSYVSMTWLNDEGVVLLSYYDRHNATLSTKHTDTADEGDDPQHAEPVTTMVMTLKTVRLDLNELLEAKQGATSSVGLG